MPKAHSNSVINEINVPVSANDSQNGYKSSIKKLLQSKTRY